MILKLASNGVLASLEASTYGVQYAFGLSLAAALLEPSFSIT